MLCLRYIFTRGISFGVAAGMGAACADAIFAMLAAVGVSAIAIFLQAHLIWFQGLAVICLFYFGCRLLFFPQLRRGPLQLRFSHLHMFFITFLLTLANPAAFFTFMALFTALGMNALAEKMPLLLAGWVFLGSVAWWLLLITLSMTFSAKLTSSLSLINRISGLFLVLFGWATLISMIWRF